MPLKQQIQAGRVVYEQPLGLFIDNKFVSSVDNQTFETINPHTEKPICSVYEASPRDVDLAVAAARRAKDGCWKDYSSSDRGKLLISLANLIDENQEVLASIESLDNGKSLQLATADVQQASGCLRYYGGWADKVHGQVIETSAESLDYTRVEPVGVCGQIIPWNFPLLMWSWKIAPAVATGNCVVIKSSELTPLSALYAATLVVKAGFPPGVINVISGFGMPTGSALTTHMDVDKVAFTGSTVVGRQILEASAHSNLKKVTLELGGKSPNIVFDDADLEAAASWVNFGIYFNQGQCCCAGSRILVQEGVYDEFLEKFKQRAAANKVGDPFEKDTFQGPQINKTQFEKILSYIEQGKKAGAVCEVGGNRIGTKGYYIEPTVFTNVTEEMAIVKEEIFGPVAVVHKFRTEEEAIKLANGTRYGLAGAVHTTNLNRAIRVSNALKAGTVWINSYNLLSYQMPFGGFKESGLGRELGQHALDNYTQVKSVRINLTSG
ncbi:aldehyde dehydrogenase (NAD(P)(+)) ald5 [Ascosphaera pollenicola]|nr:aldehyde dehydrogenase (NAD(P)(+)) ald5 [Ascosphaera pollenicola]